MCTLGSGTKAKGGWLALSILAKASLATRGHSSGTPHFEFLLRSAVGGCGAFFV